MTRLVLKDVETNRFLKFERNIVNNNIVTIVEHVYNLKSATEFISEANVKLALSWIDDNDMTVDKSKLEIVDVDAFEAQLKKEAEEEAAAIAAKVAEAEAKEAAKTNAERWSEAETIEDKKAVLLYIIDKKGFKEVKDFLNTLSDDELELNEEE